MKIFFLKNLKQWFGYFKKISVPDVLKENDSSVELPNENPIFCNLTKSQMSELVTFLQKVTAHPRQILVKEGELNDEMFILEEGEVEVLKLQKIGFSFGSSTLESFSFKTSGTDIFLKYPNHCFKFFKKNIFIII